MLVFIVQPHLVYENLESFFPFQNMQEEDVHIEQLSKIEQRALI
jgi:hypothetical protein